MAEASLRRTVDSIWLLPAAGAFAALYKDLLDFGHMLARVCESWLLFGREVWARLLGAAGEFVPLHVTDSTRDILTLWVTLSAAIGFLPLVSKDRRIGYQSTVGAWQSLGLEQSWARHLAGLSIFFASVFLLLPFSEALSALQASSLIDAPVRAANTPGLLLWFLIFAAVCFFVVFYVIGPKLEGALLSAVEQRDLNVISVSLWLISFGFLVAGLLTPPAGDGVLIVQQDFFVLSLLALMGRVTWRSAFPLVQIALLVVGVFVIDTLYVTVADIWASVSNG